MEKAKRNIPPPAVKEWKEQKRYAVRDYEYYGGDEELENL